MIAALILAVVLGGALIAAQGPIYSRMAQLLGSPLQAAALAFGVGTVALCFLILGTGTPLPRRAEIATVPLWIWAGGLIGVYVVVLSIFAVPRLGVASYMVCVILGQLGASYLYDRFGLLGLAPRHFSAANMVGLSLVAVGAALVVWR